MKNMMLPNDATTFDITKNIIQFFDAQGQKVISANSEEKTEFIRSDL